MEKARKLLQTLAPAINRILDVAPNGQRHTVELMPITLYKDIKHHEVKVDNTLKLCNLWGIIAGEDVYSHVKYTNLDKDPNSTTVNNMIRSLVNKHVMSHALIITVNVNNHVTVSYYDFK